MRPLSARARLAAFLALGALALTSPLRAETPLDVDKLNKKIDSFTLPDTTGKKRSLGDLTGGKATVVVFLSFECPVSNSYAPVLAELHGKYASRGVKVVAINSSDDGTPAELGKLSAEFKLPFPVLKDEKLLAADAFKAKVSPEAFLLDHNGVLRYRGRIDNSYAARLKKNTQTTSHDLRAALDDVLAGKDVKTPATKPVGCLIPRGEKAKARASVTYHRDILPILQNHCQQCHRPGEVGPFALMSYKQAVNWASDIKEYTQERKMPPWKPVEGVPFHNERKLTQKEIDTLATWVDGGTPEGDPKDAPPAKTFPTGWQLGKPDLVLTVPDDMVVGPSGKDVFRCFVLPTGLTEDKFVTAVEVRPGNSRIVHHSLNFHDGSGKARALEKAEKERSAKKTEQDHGPGYSVGMGVGFIPDPARFGGIGGWAPGQRARFLPEGYGYPLPKGSDFILQLHYHRNGRTEKDRTTVGLYFAKKPGTKPFKGMVIPGGELFFGRPFFTIPAGDAQYKIKGAIEVQQECELFTVMPHMHMLGKEVKVTLTPPRRDADDAGGHQGLGLQLAGNVSAKRADEAEAGHAAVGGGGLRQQQQEPEQPVQPAARRAHGRADGQRDVLHLPGRHG